MQCWNCSACWFWDELVSSSTPLSLNRKYVTLFWSPSLCRCGPGTWSWAPVICKYQCPAYQAPTNVVTCNKTVVNINCEYVALDVYMSLHGSVNDMLVCGLTHCTTYDALHVVFQLRVHTTCYGSLHSLKRQIQFVMPVGFKIQPLACFSRMQGRIVMPFLQQYWVSTLTTGSE